MQSGTAARGARSYTSGMRLEYMKNGIAGAWILGLAIVAAFLGLNSLLGWTVLAVIGLLPPIVMLRLWNPPAETTSEDIRKVLR